MPNPWDASQGAHAFCLGGFRPVVWEIVRQTDVCPPGYAINPLAQPRRTSSSPAAQTGCSHSSGSLTAACCTKGRKKQSSVLTVAHKPLQYAAKSSLFCAKHSLYLQFPFPKMQKERTPTLYQYRCPLVPQYKFVGTITRKG